MPDTHRSRCPVNLSLELFGDRWTLIVLRDILFVGKRHYRELLQSEEGISTNILADRLRMLVDEGLLTRTDDPSHQQKAIYSLTEKGISLVPVFAAIGEWALQWLPVSDAAAAHARMLAQGGPPMWEALMAELREAHLGAPRGGKTRHPVPHRGTHPRRRSR